MKRTLVTITVVMIALGAWAALRPLDPYTIANPDPNHTHTDFAVWIDGKKLDFSDEEFMSESESDQTGEDHDAHGHKHHPYLHLHDGNGYVIHRHKPGLTLGDFFASIQIGIDGACYTSFAPMADGEICGDHPFRMFLNGEEMPVTMEYVFEDLDQILFTNADSNEEVRKELQQMTDDACRYSQRCPWRGEAQAENCIADPAVPCVE
ncbi:MAG: protein-disulfide isomerase [Candidatus Peregrinibacteria bacterium Greene0416_62]|nr:MAG: protein-disulfide isomerase [Candidatus Peregrinibacteria bacterium Greene0416_62]TSD00529.1 MAG: protein-disulfide isomerase [Candidatus Peregrinibacteria bacterium Greene1014_49]